MMMQAARHSGSQLKYMAKPSYDTVLDLLKLRNGQPTDVTLATGQVVRVYNIAWVFDLGNPVAFITTNISPEPEFDHQWHSFFADEVIRIIDPENGAVWFDSSPP